MLINSILSDVPCVKVRKGMIVVVTNYSYGHSFAVGSIGKILDFGFCCNDPRIDVLIDIGNYTQFIHPTCLRLATEAEKHIYRKQLKNFKRNVNY